MMSFISRCMHIYDYSIWVAFLHLLQWLEYTEVWSMTPTPLTLPVGGPLLIHFPYNVCFNWRAMSQRQNQRQLGWPPPAFSKTSTRRSTERPMAFEAERNQSPILTQMSRTWHIVKYTSNNNQTINETNENPTNQPTKQTKNTHQTKQRPTTKQKTTKQTKQTTQLKRELFLPKTNSPASFSTSTRCISSEPGQDLWEWYIFCLPPKQEQSQMKGL